MSIDTAELHNLFEKYAGTEDLPADVQKEVSDVIAGIDKIELPAFLLDERPAPHVEIAKELEKLRDTEGAEDGEEPEDTEEMEEEDGTSQDLRYLIGQMKIPQKLKLAMFGNKECRGILISDKNRCIQEFVLKNPKLQVSEIEDFAKSPNTSDHILRSIGRNKDWMKSYNMKKMLVTNPKCPIGISITWIKHIRANDLKMIGKSKNLPQVLTTAAKKRVADLSKKK